MFHRIAEVKEEEVGPYPAITISPKTFEDIIAFFSKHFRAMALPELVSHLADGKPLPPNTFAVTFDDGFADNWSVAKPILENYEVPATIYVTTGYIDGEVFPYEFELADLIASRDAVHFHWDSCEYHWDFKNTQDREQCYTEIKRIGKPYSYALRRALMNKVLGASELPKAQGSLFMNWQQVIELSQSPLITIGAHTHRHVLLPSLTPEDVCDEIDSSKDILQAKLGGPVHHFSYPYGASNLTVQAIVQNSGFTSAVGGKPGGIYPQSFECFAIPRIELRAPPSPNLHTIPEVIQSCGYS
jgi:peptidoglycan/xylan/chitin deacetylase (PgdA/CDA1 family)